MLIMVKFLNKVRYESFLVLVYEVQSCVFSFPLYLIRYLKLTYSLLITVNSLTSLASYPNSRQINNGIILLLTANRKGIRGQICHKLTVKNKISKFGVS